MAFKVWSHSWGGLEPTLQSRASATASCRASVRHGSPGCSAPVTTGTEPPALGPSWACYSHWPPLKVGLVKARRLSPEKPESTQELESWDTCLVRLCGFIRSLIGVGAGDISTD